MKSRNMKKDLTEREQEVLQYVMQGLTNKEIADILMITHHTVKAHVAAIIRKLGVRNRLDAAMLAKDKILFCWFYLKYFSDNVSVH